jgi:hypothetical protein
MQEDEKNRPAAPMPAEDGEDLPEQAPPKEYRKLKMRVERLSLDKNQQTNEALKHIYTVLIGNPDIEISIDLPEIEVLSLFDGNSSADEGEVAGLLSPRNIVVPITDKDQV